MNSDDVDEPLPVEEVTGSTHTAEGDLDPAHASGAVDIETRGFRYADGPGHVTLTVAIADTQVRAALDPADARSLAGDLETLADAAEGDHAK